MDVGEKLRHRSAEYSGLTEHGPVFYIKDRLPWYLNLKGWWQLCDSRCQGYVWKKTGFMQNHKHEQISQVQSTNSAESIWSCCSILITKYLEALHWQLQESSEGKPLLEGSHHKDSLCQRSETTACLYLQDTIESSPQRMLNVHTDFMGSRK